MSICRPNSWSPSVIGTFVWCLSLPVQVTNATIAPLTASMGLHVPHLGCPYVSLCLHLWQVSPAGGPRLVSLFAHRSGRCSFDPIQCKHGTSRFPHRGLVWSDFSPGTTAVCPLVIPGNSIRALRRAGCKSVPPKCRQELSAYPCVYRVPQQTPLPPPPGQSA